MAPLYLSGGVCFGTHRHVDVRGKPDEYLVCFDANSLYAYCMTKKLPVGGARWLTQAEIAHLRETEVELWPDEEADFTYFLEVDLHDPRELHDAHADMPMAPEKISVSWEDLSPLSREQWSRNSKARYRPEAKLIPNLRDKTRYVLHLEALKFYVKSGLVLKTIHRGLYFKQRSFLKGN